MAKKTVALLSLESYFDEKSAQEAAKKADKTYKKALSDIANIKFDENIVKNFDEAIKVLKSKFKKVNLSSYTNKLLSSLFDDNIKIEEKAKAIEDFTNKINILKKAASGQDVNVFNTLSSRQIDSVISQTEKLLQLEEKVNAERNKQQREASKIAKNTRSINIISRNYGGQDYGEIADSLRKTLGTEKEFNAEQNQSIENLAKMINLYQSMEKAAPQKGTEAAIRYSKDLLTVTQQITEEQKKVDSFTKNGATSFIEKNGYGSISKVNDYTVNRAKEEFLDANLATYNKQVTEAKSKLATYISESVTKNSEQIAKETEGVTKKAEERVKNLQQEIAKIQTVANKPIAPNNFLESIENSTAPKTLKEVKESLYKIYNSEAEDTKGNEWKTRTEQQKAYIQAYKQYESIAANDSSVKINSDLKDQYDYLVQNSKTLRDYANQLDEANSKQKELNNTTSESLVNQNITAAPTEQLAQQEQQVKAVEQETNALKEAAEQTNVLTEERRKLQQQNKEAAQSAEEYAAVEEKIKQRQQSGNTTQTSANTTSTAEEKRNQNQRNKDTIQSSVNKALDDQIKAWKQIQSIREKISKTDSSEEITTLNRIKKEYQERYLAANKILKANSDCYDKELQMARISQIRLETDKKIFKYKYPQVASMESEIEDFYKILDAKTSIPKKFEQSDVYKNAVDNLRVSISDLKKEYAKIPKTGIVDDTTLNNLEELRGKVLANVEAFKQFSNSEKSSSKSAKWKEIDKISKYLNKNTLISKEAKKQLRDYIDLLRSGNYVNVEDIHSKFNQIAEAERTAGREGKSFFDIFKDKVLYGAAAKLSLYYLSIYDFVRYIRNGVTAIKELDTALIDLKKTTSMTSTQLEDFYYSSNDIAKQMGVTTKEIIDQASAWSRLGYSSNEAATKMAQLSSQFASVSPGMEVDQAQEGLVSIMKAWGLNENQVESEIMDPINTLGNKFAETNADLVEGMKRSAAALSAVGTSYKDAFALFTGAQEVMQNAEVVGRALRSISLRVRGYSEESEGSLLEADDELKTIKGDLIDLTKTAQNTQGISIFKEGSVTEFKSLVDYFGEINAIWDDLSEKQQNDYLQKAFGKTQAQAGAALIKNYQAVKDSLAAMEQAAGSTDREMGIIEQSIDFKINKLKETWVGTAQSMIDRGNLGTIIDALTKLSEAISWVIDNAKLLGTIGLGAGLFAGLKNVGRTFVFSF
ncbi:phage tail tape measure protein [Lachnospiraceae bacterium NSJ-143]|nr:phage tail tape measure protein [Lachnospiraceae bacterium NSJ-143]